MFRRGKLTFLTTKDDRIKIINERINHTERHLSDICNAFSTCTRKMAKFRDAYDELAKGVKAYADDEDINENLATGLRSFTNAVTILSDYMDVNVHRLELKIVNELAHFEQLCRSIRENLRMAVIARDKEVLKQRQMLELKTKFSANNSAADSELHKAMMEVQRTNRDIDELISNFEKRKLADLKTILSDFILITLKYHTKAIEVLSANYYDVSNIDEKDDLMVFQKLLKTKEENSANTAARRLTLRKGMRSQSMDSLERDQLLSPLKRSSKLSRSSKQLSIAGIGGIDRTHKSDNDNVNDNDEAEAESEQSNDDEDEGNDENDDDDDGSSEQSDNSAETGNASDDERVIQKPKPNAFGIKSRSKQDSSVNNKATERRSAVKYPFKAVAATHVPKTIARKSRPGSKSRSAMPLSTDDYGGDGGSVGGVGGVGIAGSCNRMVTVVESKHNSSMELRTGTAFVTSTSATAAGGAVTTGSRGNFLI